MPRFSRYLPALLGLTLFAAPAWALPQPKLPPEATDKPSVVVRIRPIAELLEDARYVAKLVGQEDIFNAVEPGLNPVLEALDTKKPIGFYARIRPEPVNSVGVLMIPVKNHKDLLGVLGMVGVVPNEGPDGLYSVNVPGSPFNVLFRFHDGYAYATVKNSPEAESAILKNKIFTPETLFDAKDNSLASVTFNLDAIPNALKQKALDGLDEGLRLLDFKLQNEPNPVAKRVATTAAEEMAKRAQRLVVDALTVTVRFDFDRTKEHMSFNGKMTARKGTDLANDIAAAGTGQGLGAGLAGTPSAIQFATYVAVPAALKETLEPLIDQALGEAAKSAKKHGPEVKDLLDTLAPTLKSGLLDAGIDFRGPASNGYLSMLVAVRVKDGDRVEAAFRKLYNAMDENERWPVTLDVEKVNGIAIHRAPAQPDAKFQEMVGADAKSYFAFRKDLVLLAIGEETPTLAALKAAIQASPKACPLLQGQVSMRNLTKVLEAKNEAIGQAASKAYPAGTDDLIRYHLNGGEVLEGSLSMSTRIIVYGALAEQARRNR